ncbi:hypothetical protein DESC_300034 [Desulfosarcina cetonica]|uniref:hypothetical protein n=1 Tax=Desulfosarcina cetonica TaxID=90730 RepID=UPI0006D2228A|nr:hypothetical protein [Desulfosarcina cetonica]VTR65238.1 hypothetical protein DESC_300034 [Desulfosarcina cetonica]
MNEHDDSGRFTIRDDIPDADAVEVPEAEATADTLRLDRLNARVTQVAVLLSILLIVVVAAGYLDIKNRIEKTQNYGTMGVQSLSNDLASRFSNLSLKQAKIEEQLETQAKALEAANAAMQANLKKSVAEFQQRVANKPDQAALEEITQKTANAIKKTTDDIAGLRKELTALDAAFEKFDGELAGQIQRIADGLKADQGQLAQLEKRTKALSSNQLNKESLDLALRLERLSLQEMVKEKFSVVDKKLAAVQKSQATLKQRLDTLAKARATSPPSSTKPVAPSTYTPPKPSSGIPERSSGGISEQTIN